MQYKAKTFWLAAIWALRSEMLSLRLRVPEEPGTVAGAMRASETSCSQNRPCCTNRKLLKVAPSSLSNLEWGGMDPGVIPPMSA